MLGDHRGDRDDCLIIDWDACSKTFGQDVKQNYEIMDLCVDELNKTLFILEQSLKREDLHALKKEIHRCLGGLCYLKLPQLEQALHALEEQVHKRPLSFSELKDAYEEVKQKIYTVFDYLKRINC